VIESAAGPFPSLAIETEGAICRMRLAGDWTLQRLAIIEPALAAIEALPSKELTCDWSGVTAADLSASWILLLRLEKLRGSQATVRHVGNVPEHLQLLQGLRAEPREVAPTAAAEPVLRARLHRLGRWAVTQSAGARAILDFSGRIFAVVGSVWRRPRAIRPASLARHIYETGVSAIPIVSLIAFLIAVIVAYLGAQQLQRFGADIFVVDLVTIAVLREMGVLLTAIIVAGRSGSAFAAEIGIMQINEEVDALRAMGMNPTELLVVPRVLGLVIALPLLTIVADAMGLAGGGLLSLWLLKIPLTQFVVRMQEAIAPTTFWVGIIKAPVFAFLIAMVGTLRGMQVRASARELGRLTTVAVVQAIFLVILADALFAVLFVEYDI
jgi:phospholipid/cholesterol/gamma-HCH transport system permease protein